VSQAWSGVRAGAHGGGAMCGGGVSARRRRGPAVVAAWNGGESAAWATAARGRGVGLKQ